MRPSTAAQTARNNFKETVILPDTSNILLPPIQVRFRRFSFLRLSSYGFPKLFQFFDNSQVASLISRHMVNSTSSPMVVFPKYNNYLKAKVKFDEFSRILIPLELLGIRNVVQGIHIINEIFSLIVDQ